MKSKILAITVTCLFTFSAFSTEKRTVDQVEAAPGFTITKYASLAGPIAAVVTIAFGAPAFCVFLKNGDAHNTLSVGLMVVGAITGTVTVVSQFMTLIAGGIFLKDVGAL